MLNKRSKPATILVADDDKDYRELISDFLRGEGFQTVCVEDGERALELISCQPILSYGVIPRFQRAKHFIPSLNSASTAESSAEGRYRAEWTAPLTPTFR